MDISRVLRDDIREKKRSGSGIFSRASTRKGGGNQPLRTQYYFMSKKEQKKLNGEVKTLNMNEILKLEEFEALDFDMQKRLMKHWRNKYSVKQVKDTMKVDNAKYYRLLDKLGISVEDKKSNLKPLTDEDLKRIKESFISYEELMSISTEDRYKKVLPHYLEIYSVDELAEKWSIPKQRVYMMKSNVKKHLENINNDSIKNESKDNNEVIDIENQEEVVKKDVTLSEETESVSVFADIESKFFFSLNQVGDNKSIARKLNMLVSLLEEEQGDYEVFLTVRQR